VDFTTAYQRRKRHAEFAERWEGALGAFGSAQEGLHSGQALEEQGASHAAARDDGPTTTGSPASGPPPPARLGEELSARPDGKLVKASEARWGKAAEEAFLVELTVSGSVRLAAKAAGFSTQALYKQRIKDRRFAAAWDAAIETGKARVQAYLVEAATRTFDPDELPIGDEREIPKVSIGEAISIARLKGAAATSPGIDGADYGEGEFVTYQRIEEARQRILERLERIGDNVAAHEQQTGCCHQCGQPLPTEEVGPKLALPQARFLLLDGPDA
jgi:hypothetical protein